MATSAWPFVQTFRLLVRAQGYRVLVWKVFRTCNSQPSARLTRQYSGLAAGNDRLTGEKRYKEATMRSRDRLKATVENLTQAMADGELTTAQAAAELGSYLLVFLNMYPVSYDEIAKTDLLFTLAEVMKTIELEAKVH